MTNEKHMSFEDAINGQAVELAPELRDEPTDDVIYGLFAEGVALSVIIDAVRGLTDSIHRDPAVHGDETNERTCSSIYNALTTALDLAVRLEKSA